MLLIVNLDPQVTAIGVAILTALVIFGGIARVARLSEWLVPIMAGLYIFAHSIYVVLVKRADYRV